MKYYILDDDLASRKILSRIITDEFLGEVVGESENPQDAEIEIVTTKPEVVLIDLLMPVQDGIETVHNLRNRNFNGKFIMISQIENKEIVAKAYQEGIEYFIHKPINRVEVSSIIHKVIEQINMKRSLNKIKESLAYFNITSDIKKTREKDAHTLLQHILGDLGILGEGGSNDLMDIIDYFFNNKKTDSLFAENIPLKDLYVEVLKNKNKQLSEKDLKSLEQRIRRTVTQAMTNLSSLGLTDYAHPKFEHYATKFFDFNEIRLKMRELEKGDNNNIRKAKINLKKFIYALYNEAISKLENEY